MTHPLQSALRKAVSVFVWTVLAAGIFHEGAEWALKKTLTRVLHVAAPDARLHLFRLTAESTAGEGLWRGVAVRWRGATVRLFGRSGLESFELGPALAPVLRVRGLRLDRLWPLMRGTVDRIDVSSLRTEWRRLAGGPSAEPSWRISVPLDLEAKVLSFNTPWGLWQGPASVEGEDSGRSGRWSAELRGESGSTQGSGRWSESGVEGEFVAEGQSGTKGHGVASWGATGLNLQFDASSAGERWTADARGRQGKFVQVVVVHVLSGKNPQSLSFRAEPGRAADSWPVVRDLSGEVRLPDFHLARGISLLDVFLKTDQQSESGPGETCVALLARGRLSAPRRSYMVQSALQVRQRPGEGLEGSFEGQAMPAPSPRLDLFAEPFYWRLSGRSLESGGRFDGVLKAGTTVAAADISSDHGVWNWRGNLRSPEGLADTRGSYEGGKWSGAGTCELKAPRAAPPPWPLPVGPLKGKFELDGDLDGLDHLELEASGNGSWHVSTRRTGWRMRVKGGALRGGGLSVGGLDAEATGRGAPALSGGGSFKASIQAQTYSYGDRDLGGMSMQASLQKEGLQLTAVSDLNFLGGKASATLSVDPLGKDWRLSAGTVQLVSGAVRFEGVQGTWNGRTSDPVYWTATGAGIFGEELASLQGDCLFGGPSSAVDLSAHVKHWGGDVAARLSLGAGRPLDLVLNPRGVSASAVPPYIRQWVDLPFRTGEGTVDGTVTIPLEHPAEGLSMAVDLNQVDLQIGGPDRVLPKASGRFYGNLAGGKFRIPEASLTLGATPVPVAFSLDADAERTKVSFMTPSVPAERLQVTVFDFLPEMLGYGTFQGATSVAGSLSASGDQVRLDLTLQADDLGYLSEDKSLRVKGIRGSLPLSLDLGGGSPDLTGYAAPGRNEHRGAFEQLGRACDGNPILSVDRVRFSVFSADHLKLRAAAENGALLLGLCDGEIWGGALRGQARIAVSKDGLRYAGQIMARGASLKAFCEQSGALRGFISGVANATLTLGGDAAGLARAKALAEIWVDPEGAEPKVISRDFLVKMGGERIRSLLHSNQLEYDKAAFQCGLSGGILSVYELELQHQANPVKALVRKDVSFEVRVPQKNSISLDQLVKNIKNLEVQAGVGKVSPSRPRVKR